MPIFCGPVKIKDNVGIASGIYHMVLECPEVAAAAAPGQFIHIRCSDTLSPLLRRPISIAMARRRTGTVEIIYRVVGEGTRLLARKAKGDMLDIMGPLGKGFPIEQDIKRPAIVGGGIGMAPLLFLAHSINESKLLSARSAGSPVNGAADASNKTGDTSDKPGKGFIGTAFAGFSTEKEIFGLPLIEDCGFKTEICTDDGSRGYRGYPTDLLEKYLSRGVSSPPASTGGKTGPAGMAGHPRGEPLTPADIIYACGPGPLLSKVKAIASRAGVPAYISLEERMACGIGACLGCAVKSAGGGYLKVCKDGPVFETSSVDIQIS